MSIADFLTAPYPEPVALPEAQITGPQRFFNRELSWLAFNWRVLEEAGNARVPLLERVRFVSISAGNLDEFYTVRVAGLRELAQEGHNTLSDDGRTPAEQLKLINADARQLMQHQQAAWNGLQADLEREGITVVTTADLSKADRAHLEEVFLTQVFPVLSPLAIDPAHPFPFIPNEGIALALKMKRASDGRVLRALLPIPNQIDRFIRLPAPDGAARFLALEDLLVLHVGALFPGYHLAGSCSFRILRDSDLEVEEEAEDLVREFETALKRRRRGEVVRLQISHGAPEDLKAEIVEQLRVTDDEVVDVKGMIGLVSLKELVIDDRADLLWKSFTPRVPERVQDHDGDMFAAIRQKDMLLHHPYETFDMVIRFLAQAARDPNVVAIKQTLYRTSNESPIVEALCEAAESGKSVTALVELKARFDEAANIRQSRKLERSGAHVVYGFINYKTHAKISTVVRREGDRLVTYTHYGTGNYHPITAKIYTDLSLFTCDDALGRDATKVFNYVGGYAEPEGLENLPSRRSPEATIIDGLKAEAEHARAGKPAMVWAKMNSLIEPDVIDALYEASQAGREDRPRDPGHLRAAPRHRGAEREHPGEIHRRPVPGAFAHRLFRQRPRAAAKKARSIISSADWMGRNLNRRVETLVECTNPTVKAQIVSQIMAANLADVAQSWVLQPDGSFVRPDLETDREPVFLPPLLHGKPVALRARIGRGQGCAGPDPQQ
jgi:polyphosphate kinase